MNNDLLPYYNKELTELQRLGAAFAKAHPKIAKNLGLDDGGVEDPHVSRLIESIAFLNARVQRKLDDSIPDSIKSLLEILYPHYQAPMPSMAMIQFPASPGLDKSYTVPRNAKLETDPKYGEVCSFRTCYDTKVWPLEVTDAKLTEYYKAAPKLPYKASTPSVLRLSVKLLKQEAKFANMAPDSLRFFIKGGQQLVYRIHELLFNDTVAITLANSASDKNPILLDKNCLQPVGFADDESILPYPAESFKGYRLLSEFFVFPEKFLFFELNNLKPEHYQTIDNNLEIFFYLKQPHHELKSQIDGDNFIQGCTPIINLFERRAEPITLTNTTTEYPVIPNIRKPELYEVYAINNITALAPNGDAIECQPFYGLSHSNSEDKVFWHKIQRDTVAMDKTDNLGIETCIALVDTTGKTIEQDNWVLNVNTICTNRNLPRQLFLHGITPRLQFAVGSSPVSEINWIITPTPTYKPALQNDNQWRLISHLSLNQLSLTIKDGSALKELLQLYNFTKKPEIDTMIMGINGIITKRTTARLPGKSLNSFAAGLEVTIDIDKIHFPQGQVILFGSVLEQFLSMYCALNSFTQLIITTDNQQQELHRWQPRTGSKQLL